MMKKGILIGVLAALMLFAFTACEQNTPNSPLYGAQVESVTVAEQPVYIYLPVADVMKDVIPSNIATALEDKIDPSEVKFRVNYNDGKSYVYTGTQLGLTDTAAVVGPSTAIKVSLDKAGRYVFYPQVKAYAATSAIVSPSAVAEPYELNDGTKLSVKLDVTLASAGGSKVFSLGSRDLIANDDVDALIEDRNLEYGDALTITAEEIMEIPAVKSYIDGINRYFPVTVSGSIEAVYVDASATYTTFTVKQANTIYANIEGIGNDAKTSLEDAGLTLTTYDKDGNVVDASITTGFTVYDADGIKFNDAYTWEKADTYDVTVKYGEVSIPATIKVSSDYPVAYEVAEIMTEKKVDDEFTEYYEYTPGEEIDLDTVEFTIKTWASSSTTKYEEKVAPTDYTKPDWTVVPLIIPTDITLSEDGEANFKDCTFESGIEGVVATWASSAKGFYVVEEKSTT